MENAVKGVVPSLVLSVFDPMKASPASRALRKVGQGRMQDWSIAIYARAPTTIS
jgi:hypothetical protein